MAGGEVGNFLAYGMAPASLVSPLGAVTGILHIDFAIRIAITLCLAVISNAVLSRIFLKEHISWVGIAGVLCALCGAVLIALNAPTAEAGATESGDARGKTPPERVIYDSLITWRTFVYVIVVLLGASFIANPFKLSFAISEEFAKKQVICYCFLCGLMGAITVMSSKGISTAINEGLSGKAAMFVEGDICWLTYALILSAAGSIVLQMKYLNEALMNFGSSLVVPVYYIVFTSITISAGMVVFLEISFDPVVRSVLLFVAGLLLAFFGVYLINSQKVEEGDHKAAAPGTDGKGAETQATREELQVLFEDLDKNHSGGLDRRELSGLADALGEAWREEHFVARLMEKMDADKSGAVSFDEFERWYHDDYDAAERPEALRPEQRAALDLYAHKLAERLRLAQNVLAAIGSQAFYLKLTARFMIS